MAEIIAKLGLDDSKFERGLTGASRKATGILGLLQRKFGAADLFKDTIRGLGAGLGAGGIAAAVSEHFQTAAESAKQLASHTADLYQTTLRLIGVAGGPTRELQLQARQVKDLTRDIEDQRRLLASFSILDKVRNPGMILEQEQLLQSMIKQQGDLAAGIDITIMQENRRTEALQRQQQLAANLAASELRGGDEQEKIAYRLLAIEKEITAAKKQGALPSTLQALYNQRQALEDQAKIVLRDTNKKRLDDEFDALKKVIVAEKQLREARGALAGAKRDALAFSVDDAASGTRGTVSDRVRARAIQRDESRARRLFDSGLTVTEFDSKTQRNEKRGAAFFQNRALSMRENFGKLNSSERKPFGSLEEKLDETNKHLTAVEAALKPTKTNSGGSK